MRGLARIAIEDLVVDDRPKRTITKNTEIWSLNLDQIESDSGRILSKVKVSSDALGPSTYPFEAGAVLYSKLRPYLNKVVIADEDGYATTELVPLRCNTEKVMPSYLAYFLRSSEFLNFANTVVAGAKMPRMVMSEFWKYKIPLPPLPEQRRIAAILDQADALRAKRREALAELDKLAQSIFVEMFGDPVANPKGWDSCTVGDVTDCIVPGRDKPKSFSGEIPWVTTEDLLHLGFTVATTKGLGLSSQEICDVRARVIPVGSVIMSCVGNLGVITIAGREMVINQQLHSFQCGEAINNLYLMYFLNTQTAFMYSRASSTTLPYMNKTVCNSIPIHLPPRELQDRFANRISLVMKEREIQKTFLSTIEQLFASLQHRAFRGEL